MVRRQTMQIEAEKRALLRWTLIVVTILFAASLVLSGFMYQRYSSSDNAISQAEERAQKAESDLNLVSKELEEKKALLEKNAAALAKENAIIESTVPRMLNRSASDRELAELAHAIYNQPGHVIELPSIPPNEVLRNYRLPVNGRPHKYTIVPGLLDSKWVIYSVLVKNQEDK